CEIMEVHSFPTRRSSDLFDNDEAGNKAAAKYKEELQALLPAVTFTKVILPNKDVNETLQAHSNEEIFIDLLNQRTTEFFLSIEKDRKSTRLNSSHVKISY